MAIAKLAQVVLAATRKGFFQRNPIFEPYAQTSPEQIQAVETTIGMALPDDLREWLLQVGYGDLGDELSFRAEWFAAIRTGQLKGGATFAQDILGNFYAFDASDRHIYYLCRSEAVYASISPGFTEFLEELIRRDYKLEDWVDDLETRAYDW